MKRLVLFLMAASFVSAIAFAQSARQLTRRIAPQLPPPPVQARPAPGPGLPVATGPAATVPQPTPQQKEQAEKKLLEFHKTRAEKGSDTAQYEMGMRYLTGKGVEKDEKKALDWFQKSADGGNSLAKRKLAELKPAAATAVKESK